MRYLRLCAVLVLIVAACAEQNNPLPQGEGDDTSAGKGTGGSGGKATGGKASGGTTTASAGTSTGGTSAKGGTSAGGTAEAMAGEGGETTLPVAGKTSGGSGGTGGKASGGAGGTAGSGGKGGTGGATGGGGSGSGGAGCTPTTSAPVAGLSARYKPEQTADSGYSIGSELSIANIGPNTMNLADLKLRYYFTNEVQASVTESMNWAYVVPNAGGAQGPDVHTKVMIALVPMACKTASADTYLEFTFAADAGTVTPGNQIHFSWVATNVASQKFTQTNDYSFNAAAQITDDDPKLVILQNSGSRAWGTEP